MKGLTRLFFRVMVPCILLMGSCTRGPVEYGLPKVTLLPRNDTEGSGKNKVITVKAKHSHASDLPVTVTYSTEDSTAKANLDYIPIDDSTFVFNPGETLATFHVTFISDTITEFTKAFKIIITKVDNGQGIGESLPITITDDDFYNVSQTTDGYISPLQIPGMRLMLAEEFTDSLSPLFDFNYDIGQSTLFNQLQTFTNNPQNIKVSNGNLVITARKDGDKYTSAGLNTRSIVYFQYGLIMIRAKMPKGTGIWPSFWMLGNDFDGTNWPLCGQIDIATLRGQDPNQMMGAVYYYLSDVQERQSYFSLPLYTDTFSDEYHVFSILWQPDQIQWYVDNKKYMTFSKSDVGDSYVFNSQFWLNITLAVGGNLVGDPDFSTQFPQTMKIDYIRWYLPK